jgi:glutamate:GABA antiporter
MSATHAAEMKNPQKDYPRSLFISAIIILTTIILGSLAIAIVVPKKELSLVIGVMQTFQIFATKYNLLWLPPLLAGCIILGSLSSAGAWIIGPTKGLLVASQDKSLPSFLSIVNKHDVPIVILIIQAIIVSLLSLFFVFMPTINSSFWILSAITAQLALVGYIFLFMAALKLYYKKSIYRTFNIPAKKIVVWSMCVLGSISCFVVILFGFFPPNQISIGNILLYEFILVTGMILFCFIPLLFFLKKRSI